MYRIGAMDDVWNTAPGPHHQGNRPAIQGSSDLQAVVLLVRLDGFLEEIVKLLAIIVLSMVTGVAALQVAVPLQVLSQLEDALRLDALVGSLKSIDELDRRPSLTC